VVMVTFEWVVGIAVLIIGGLLAAVWNMHGKLIDKNEADIEGVAKDAADHDKTLHTKLDDKTKEIWSEINAMKKDQADIKGVLGEIRAELKAFDTRIKDLPNHEKLHTALRESEERIINTLVGLLKRDV